MINKVKNFKCSSKREIKELLINNQSYEDNYNLANLLNESLTILPINIKNLSHRSSVFTHYSQFQTYVLPVNSFYFPP